MMDRDALLTLEDGTLLSQCRVDTARGRGPGGQKRNKTESAVQITHIESGISAYNDVSRSQHQNKTAALQRLRLEIALKLRSETMTQPGQMPSLKSDAYPLWAARVLDFLASNGYRISDAAAQLDMSTSQLVKALSKCPPLWQFVNAQRVSLGLKQIKM